MLRVAVALLLLANAVFFTWSRGWLDALAGVRAIGDREPERLAQQVRPEAVRILGAQTPGAGGGAPVAVPGAAASSGLPADAGGSPGPRTGPGGTSMAGTTTAAPLACLEAGPFDDAGVVPAEGALQSTLPAGTWSRHTTERPSGWIVYLGRFANRETLQRREQELARMSVDYLEIRNVAELEPGLELARFRDRQDAAAALADLARRGVQGGRLVQLRALPPLHMLRVERADPELATRVGGLRLDALGRGFQPCGRPAS